MFHAIVTISIAKEIALDFLREHNSIVYILQVSNRQSIQVGQAKPKGERREWADVKLNSRDIL